MGAARLTSSCGRGSRGRPVVRATVMNDGAEAGRRVPALRRTRPSASFSGSLEAPDGSRGSRRASAAARPAVAAALAARSH
jgi:hypothetical protein